MPNRRSRVDSNHAAIVAALRKCGCTVQSLATVGVGCPDLLVGVTVVPHTVKCLAPNFTWRVTALHNYLLEIKDGSKSPSRRKLTADEQRWHDDWKGQVCVVNSVDEALAVVGVTP